MDISLSSTGFPISITSTSGCGLIRLGDCSASSPLGLRGFFIDFGVLASTSSPSFTGSSRLPFPAPVAHLWPSRHHSRGAKLTKVFEEDLSRSCELHRRALCWRRQVPVRISTARCSMSFRELDLSSVCIPCYCRACGLAVLD